MGVFNTRQFILDWQRIHGDLLAALNQQLNTFADDRPGQPTTTFQVKNRRQQVVYDVTIHWDDKRGSAFKVVATTNEGTLADLLPNQRWTRTVQPPTVERIHGSHWVTFYYGLPRKK